MTPLVIAGVLSVLGLLAAALIGLLMCRNFIKIVIALQLLGKSVVVGLIVAGQVGGQVNLGQSLAITVIVADTVVAVVGLALAVQVHRRLGTLDVRALSTLRG